VTLKQLSKEKKKELTRKAEVVVDRAHVQGALPSPIKLSCDVLILDDKSHFQFPKGCHLNYQYGIFILFDPLNFGNMGEVVQSVGGIINLSIPCLTTRSPRPAYSHPQSPKTTMVQLIVFSKKQSNHIPWVLQLSENISFPLVVSIYIIFFIFILIIFQIPALSGKEKQKSTGPYQINFSIPISFWMVIFKVTFWR
jgi:hypothetical protein